MNDSGRIDTPSIRNHKRQLAWQILVPVILAALIIIAGAVLVIIQGSSTDRVVADIATMWLIIPVVIMLFVLLAAAVGLIYGTAKLTQIIPPFSGKIQSALVSVENTIRKVADGSAKPFIFIDQVGAAIKSIFKRRKR